MIKYSVNTTSFEFNPTKCDGIEDAFFKFEGDANAKPIAICDTLEEAREILSQLKVSTHRYSYKLAYAEMAYIEEADFEYDEELESWEFISGSNYWDITGEELN
jgi:hypothetical protein